MRLLNLHVVQGITQIQVLMNALNAIILAKNARILFLLHVYSVITHFTWLMVHVLLIVLLEIMQMTQLENVMVRVAFWISYFLKITTFSQIIINILIIQTTFILQLVLEVIVLLKYQNIIARHIQCLVLKISIALII